MTVLTFNIRYPEPADGPHVWENRREAVVETLRSANADVAGLQEPVIEQIEYLAKALPAYAWIGVSRYGDRTEKFTPLFYNRGKLKLLNWNTFWLSETPDVVGSHYPEMEKPRIVTWALFEDQRARTFACFNTHLQYRKEEHSAKIRSASLIRNRIVAQSWPSILTGDFNHPAGEEVHAILTRELQDAWLEAPGKEGPEGTFHGFTGQPISRHRLDWLLFRAAPFRQTLRAVSCRVLTAASGGVYPSDHFPVAADFEWEQAK